MIDGIVAALTRGITGANARWIGCAPAARQRIYFANHTSHLDAVVLWSILPLELRQHTRPVAAKDYWSKSRVRQFVASEVFRSVLIDRENVSARNNPIDLLGNALEQGSSLIIFPEGTRGSGDEMKPFKSGLYHLSRKMQNVEFVPVYIDNMNRILPKGEFLPIPLLTCVTFGSPLQIREGESKSEFLLRARESVASLRTS